jgi:hypothetical protein
MRSFIPVNFIKNKIFGSFTYCVILFGNIVAQIRRYFYVICTFVRYWICTVIIVIIVTIFTTSVVASDVLVVFVVVVVVVVIFIYLFIYLLFLLSCYCSCFCYFRQCCCCCCLLPINYLISLTTHYSLRKIGIS